MENEPRRDTGGYSSQRRDYGDRPRGNYERDYNRGQSYRGSSSRGGYRQNQSRGFNRDRPSNIRSDSKDGRQPLSYSFSDDKFQPKIALESFEPIKKDFYMEHETTAKRTPEEVDAFMAEL